MVAHSITSWESVIRQAKAACRAAALCAVLGIGGAPPAVADYDEGAAAYIEGDYHTAYEEWRELGLRGHQAAQYNIGVLYANGLGIPRDEEIAVEWFRMAADRGLPAAQLKLGKAYLEGKGVPQDPEEAYYWFTLAASHYQLGEERDFAIAARDSVSASLTPQQIAKVLDRAVMWKPVGETIPGSERAKVITDPVEVPAQQESATPEPSKPETQEQLASAAPTTIAGPTSAAMSEAEAGTAASAAASDPAAEAAGANDGQGGALDTSTNSAAATAEAGTEAVAGTSAPATEPTNRTQQVATTQAMDVRQAPFALHLSSVRARDDVEGEWKKLRKRFPDLLGESELVVRLVEIEDQGTFYRVLTGAFFDYQVAEQACAPFKSRDQYCLAVRIAPDPPNAN